MASINEEQLKHINRLKRRTEYERMRGELVDVEAVLKTPPESPPDNRLPFERYLDLILMETGGIIQLGGQVNNIHSSSTNQSVAQGFHQKVANFLYI